MRDTIREDVVPKLTINRNMMPSETASVKADYRCLGPWCAEKGTWEFGMATVISYLSALPWCTEIT